jgi:hypothetical protein
MGHTYKIHNLHCEVLFDRNSEQDATNSKIQY